MSDLTTRTIINAIVCLPALGVAFVGWDADAVIILYLLFILTTVIHDDE